jgi:hypothetical protein
MDQVLQYGQVAPVAITASLPNGTQSVMRLGNMGETVVSQLHAPLYEATYRRAKFFGSNGATPSVTTVALATTYTGLVLYNPAGTTVNLVVDTVGYSFLVAFTAAATVGLMVGYAAAGIVTASAAASPGASSFVGGGTPSQGKCALSATLVGTPVLHTVFGAGLTGAISTAPQNQTIYDMGGSLILPPGAYAAIYTSTASGAASLAASFQWEEVPV